MDTKVTGVFRNLSDAEQVQSEIIRAGIDTTNIKVVGGSKAHGDQGDGFWDSLRDFFSMEDESTYSEATRRGSPVVVVSVPQNDVDEVVNIMQRYHPLDIDEETARWQAEGWSHDASKPDVMAKKAEQKSMQVVEEQLKVGKRKENRGGVRIHSHVSEKPVEETVELREENVRVERNPVDKQASTADFQEESFEMRETREEPVVSKEARVVEEVSLRKDVDKRSETIKDTVKRKDVSVDTLEDDFRLDYDRNFASRGYSYDEIRPAYEHGSQMAARSSGAGNWRQDETAARNDYEQKHPGKWNEFKPAVERGYRAKIDRDRKDQSRSAEAS